MHLGSLRRSEGLRLGAIRQTRPGNRPGFSRTFEKMIKIVNGILKYEPECASGRREGWARQVREVVDEPGGYAFQGAFMREGENPLRSNVIIEMTPEGSAKDNLKTVDILVVDGDQIESIGSFDLRREHESLKAAVREAIGQYQNPLSKFTTAQLREELARREAALE